MQNACKINLEINTVGSSHAKLAVEWLILPLKSGKCPKFIRESNFGLKLLTFRLSNVLELETTKYTYAVTTNLKTIKLV